MNRTLRGLLAAAALLAALPAAAAADTVDGVVVARDAERGTVVTAGRGGDVTTLRVARAAGFKPGQRVRASATRLGDGTYRASAVKRRGRAGAAKLRATVVRRSGREYVVAAGASTFAVRAGRRARLAHPGAVVAARLRVAKGKAVAEKLQQTGQAATVVLEGRVVGVADGVLKLAVGAQGPLAVAVPAGVDPAVKPGDEVELLVAVDGFTLLAVDGEIEVSGAVTAVSDASISVGAVTCAVPDDLDVSDVVPGDVVLLVCAVVDGVLTAEELEFDDFGLDEDDLWLDDEDEPFDEDEELDPEE